MKVSKFEWKLDDIGIEKIISPPISAAIFFFFFFIFQLYYMLHMVLSSNFVQYQGNMM